MLKHTMMPLPFQVHPSTDAQDPEAASCLPRRSPLVFDPREERGLRIARQEGYVVPRQSDPKSWNVRSESRNTVYSVQLDPLDLWRCSCPDFELRRQSCKHIIAVEYALGRRTVPEETAVVRRTYPQNWPAYNAAKRHEKPLFIEMLGSLCETVQQPEQRKGRPRLALGDVVFAEVFKVYVGTSSRRFTGHLEEADDKCLISKVPHFNSVTNYLSKTELTPVLEGLVTLSSLPLSCVERTVAVDSSGFSTSRFVPRYSQRQGRETDNREWVKGHVLCGVKTNVVVSALVTEGSANDSPSFPLLLERAAPYLKIGEVLADKAYLSRGNVEAVARVGAVPFIPPKINTLEPRLDGSMWSRMIYFCMFNRDAFLHHYHQRSNVETTFSMIKMKFGIRCVARASLDRRTKCYAR